MKNVLMTLAILGLALSTPTQAEAVLTSAGDLVFGADSVTQDSVSGLEWLDLTRTTNRSYNDLIGLDGTNEFLPTGDFAGWRHAVIDEVFTLFTNAGFTGINTANIPANFVPAQDLMAIMGGPTFTPFNLSIAFTASPGPFNPTTAQNSPNFGFRLIKWYWTGRNDI